MTNSSAPESAESRTLDAVLDGLHIGMLGTTTPSPSSRPLTLAEIDGDTLRFLVSNDTSWVEALRVDPTVLLTFGSDAANVYVALTGRADVSNDRKLVTRLYSKPADAFFDGPDDPDAAVLEVDVEYGEWWDGPSGRVGKALALARATITGDGESVGDSGPVDVG